MLEGVGCSKTLINNNKKKDILNNEDPLNTQNNLKVCPLLS